MRWNEILVWASAWGVHVTGRTSIGARGVIWHRPRKPTVHVLVVVAGNIYRIPIRALVDS